MGAGKGGLSQNNKYRGNMGQRTEAPDQKIPALDRYSCGALFSIARKGGHVAKEEIKEYLKTKKAFSTHSHHLSDAQHEGMTLGRILEKLLRLDGRAAKGREKKRRCISVRMRATAISDGCLRRSRRCTACPYRGKF